MLKVKGKTPQTIFYNNKNVNTLRAKKNNVITTVWQKASNVARYGSAIFGTSKYN